MLAYFALASDVLGITPPSAGTAFFYYALFAFAAGFSERFAHVILGSADLTVSKGLTGTQTAESEGENAPLSQPAEPPADAKYGQPPQSTASRSLNNA